MFLGLQTGWICQNMKIRQNFFLGGFASSYLFTSNLLRPIIKETKYGMLHKSNLKCIHLLELRLCFFAAVNPTILDCIRHFPVRLQAFSLHYQMPLQAVLHPQCDAPGMCVMPVECVKREISSHPHPPLPAPTHYEPVMSSYLRAELIIYKYECTTSLTPAFPFCTWHSEISFTKIQKTTIKLVMWASFQGDMLLVEATLNIFWKSSINTITWVPRLSASNDVTAQ